MVNAIQASELSYIIPNLFCVKEPHGHADISMTMRHAHLAQKTFQDELQRIFARIYAATYDPDHATGQKILQEVVILCKPSQ